MIKKHILSVPIKYTANLWLGRSQKREKGASLSIWWFDDDLLVYLGGKYQCIGLWEVLWLNPSFFVQPSFLGFNRQTLQNGPSNSDPNQNKIRHVHIAVHIAGVKYLKVLQVTLTHHPTIVYCLSSASHISRSLQKCLRDTWAPVQECLYFASFACRIPS